MLMADMGAEVIKIELPEAPDPMRHYPPLVGEESAGYLAVNRNKKSLALDYTREQGREVFCKLVANADLVVEQFRPGVLNQLGLGFKNARQHNSKIIYVSLTGYGQTGPYRDRPGHDINYLGYSGMLASTGPPDGPPILPAGQIADVAGAYMTVIACLSALWSRLPAGAGQHVDVAMLDAVLPFMTLQLARLWASNHDPGRGQHLLSGGLACYGVYECADGKYVALGALEPKFWQQFCEIAGKREWVERQFSPTSEQAVLKAEVKAIFRSKPLKVWFELTAGKEACLSSVLELSQLSEDPQLVAREMITSLPHNATKNWLNIGTPLKFGCSPASRSSPPPALGQHTAEILQAAGYTPGQIAALQAQGMIFCC